jgi:hypothetical protein
MGPASHAPGSPAIACLAAILVLSWGKEKRIMIELITEGIKDNVVAMRAEGTVDHEDYQRVIVPAIERKIESYPKIRVLYQLGDDFTGYSAGAIWDDAKLGMHYRHSFEKAAVVTETEWIRKSLSFFRFLIPCPVRLFHNGELSQAIDWINE